MTERKIATERSSNSDISTMRALLILAGSLFGGVCGGAITARLGTWIEDEMTEEEMDDFRWVCDRLELPVPQNPGAPGREWKIRMDQRISELPEEEADQVRAEVAEILEEHDVVDSNSAVA